MQLARGKPFSSIQGSKSIPGASGESRGEFLTRRTKSGGRVRCDCIGDSGSEARNARGAQRDIGCAQLHAEALQPDRRVMVDAVDGKQHPLRPADGRLEEALAILDTTVVVLELPTVASDQVPDRRCRARPAADVEDSVTLQVRDGCLRRVDLRVIDRTELRFRGGELGAECGGMPAQPREFVLQARHLPPCRRRIILGTITTGALGRELAHECRRVDRGLGFGRLAPPSLGIDHQMSIGIRRKRITLFEQLLDSDRLVVQLVA